MNISQAIVQDLQPATTQQAVVVELSEVEIQLIAGGTAITNSI